MDRSDDSTDLTETAGDPGDRIAGPLARSGRTAAVAESLTGGNVSAALSAIEAASDWFRGGVVAYDEQVKFDLLGVDRGPVINRGTAEQMAIGVARLLSADFAVATTGVGGPGPQEDHPQGTVYIAVAGPDRVVVSEHRFAGEPAEVIEHATRQALSALAAEIAR